MSTKAKNMVTRGLSGVVYIAVVIFCATHSIFTLAGMLFVFQTIATREYKKLTSALGFPVHYGALMLAATALHGAALALVLNDIFLSKLLLSVSLIVVFGAFVFEIFYPKKSAIVNLSHFVLGYIYVGVPFALTLFVSNLDDVFSSFRILGIFIIIWTFDTFAYIAGNFFGKRKLAPNVSPGKTIEGLIGGAIASIIAGAVLYPYDTSFSMYHWMGLALLLSITSTLGDLFESRLKREAKVKDSGSFMPGHGGLLDRLDSFLFSMPFVYFYFIAIHYFSL